MNYSIGIGINDLVSQPARSIQNALTQIQTMFAGLRGSMSGNSASLESVRNSLSGVSNSSNQASARIRTLSTELNQMRDFRFTLDVNVDADLVREVDEEIRRLQGSISQLDANRVNVRTDTTQLETLNRRLASLRTDRIVAVNTNVNASELLALDIQINETEQELRRLSQPQNINITGGGILGQITQSVRTLTGAIRNEGTQASVSASQNQRFVTMLNGLPSSANASARSIDRLQAEVEQLTTRRNSLDINVNSRDVIRCNAEIRALQRQISTAQGASNGGWFQKLFSGGALSFLGGNLMFSAVQGAISGISAGVQGAMDLEKTKISFGTFSENKALGKAMRSGKPYDEKQVREQARSESDGTIKDLNKYADQTSFENPDVLRVGAKMSGYLDQGEIVKKIKIFGDISGGDVGKLDSLELVYSQIKDAGKMQGQDLSQLINGGAFGIMDELAKVKNIDVSKVRDAMKDGQISFQDVDTALNNMTTKGGNFYGVMDKQSVSTFGRLSTLIGGVKTKFYEAFITADFPVFSQLIDLGQAIFDNFSKISEPFSRLVGAFAPIGSAISNVFSKLTGGATLTESVSNVMNVLGGIMDWVAGGIGVLASVMGYLIESPVVQWIAGLVTGAYALSGAMTLVNIVMSANPFFLLVAGVGLAISGIKMLWDNCETFREVVTGVFEGIKAVWQPIGAFFSGIFGETSGSFLAFGDFIRAFWDLHVAVFEYARSWIGQKIDWIGQKITQAKEFLSTLFAPIVKIWEGIKIKLGSVFDWISEKLKSVMGFMGKVFNMLPQVQLAKWGINAGKQVYDNFKSGFEKDKIQGVVSFKKDKEEKAKQEKGVATNLPKTDKNTVIPPPFSGKDGKKGKDIGDKSGVNKTVEGSKPTVINVTFGAVTGANYLTQNLSGNDTQSKANEIVDLVVEQIIRRIGSSVAIAG